MAQVLVVPQLERQFLQFLKWPSAGGTTCRFPVARTLLWPVAFQCSRKINSVQSRLPARAWQKAHRDSRQRQA
jgi:hypothetical protein